MRYWWVALVACLVLLPPSLAHAAPGDPVEVQVLELRQEIAELKAEVTKLQAEKEHYEYLKEEAKALREYVQQERDGLQGFLLWLLVIAGAFVTLGTALAAYFGVQTKKEIHAQVVEAAQKVREEAIAKYKKLMDDEVKQVEGELTDLVRNRSWYQKSRVLVVGQPALVSDLSHGPLRLLVRKGMKVTPAQADSPDLEEKLKEQGTVVVYRYNQPGPELEDPALMGVVELIASCGSSVPLIVYTGEQRVTRNEQGELSRLIPMHTLANNHITLLSHVHSLARIMAHAD